MLPNSQKWVICQSRTHGPTYKVQKDITFPESTSTCHWEPAGSKAGLGEGFNPQDLLRDGHHLRSFGRELTGPGDGGQLAVLTTLRGPWDTENGISAYKVSPSCDASALCPVAARDRTINSLEAGPGGSQVVFLVPILLSTDHASSTLNVLSLSFQKHLRGRFYVEGH